MRTIAVPRPDLTDAASIIRIGGIYFHISLTLTPIITLIDD